MKMVTSLFYPIYQSWIINDFFGVPFHIWRYKIIKMVIFSKRAILKTLFLMHDAKVINEDSPGKSRKSIATAVKWCTDAIT